MAFDRHIRTLIVLFMLSALPQALAQQDAQMNAATVTATRVASLPKELSVRVMPGPDGNIDETLIAIAESQLQEQGLTITASARYTLYLSRTGATRKRTTKSPVAVSIEGGGARVERAQVAVPIVTGKKKETGATAVQEHGLEGRLEGPGGLVYWRVKAIAHATAGAQQLDHARLLRHALATFGQTVVREIDAATQ